MFQLFTHRPLHASFISLHVDTNASKTKKFKGTITLSEVSPGTDAESSITFKNALTASQDKSVSKASSALRDLVLEKMKLFEIEFKAM